MDGSAEILTLTSVKFNPSYNNTHRGAQMTHGLSAFKEVIFMTGKRLAMITGFRILSVLTCLIVYFRISKISVIFTAIAVMFVAIWLLPNLLTALAMIIFKIKENYYGTLLYDDSDITDCKFRMIFNVDPEIMAKESKFLINVERANLRDERGINPFSNGKE